MAWARLKRIAGKDVPAGLPPVDHYDFYRILPHPDPWVRVRWWAWRLRSVLTGTELHVWDEWRKEMVAMNCPAIPFTAAEVRRKAYL